MKYVERKGINSLKVAVHVHASLNCHLLIDSRHVEARLCIHRVGFAALGAGREQNNNMHIRTCTCTCNHHDDNKLAMLTVQLIQMHSAHDLVPRLPPPTGNECTKSGREPGIRYHVDLMNVGLLAPVRTN